MAAKENQNVSVVNPHLTLSEHNAREMNYLSEETQLLLCKGYQEI